MDTNQRSAFTLVELAIVLVVIGLIMGGVMGGQALLRTSQLRSTMSDLTNYAQAINNFRTEFRYLPGDLPTASSYWGAADGTTGSTAGCYTIDKSTGTATCNGNGNGLMQPGDVVSGTNMGLENFLAWQHLANAGLITGAFTGKNYTANSYGTMAGVNTPAGRISGMAYLPDSNGYNGATCYTSDTYLFDGCYDTVLFFGSSQPTTNFWPGAILTPEEMYGMDKKLDDGLPGAGQFRAWKNALYGPTCVTDANNYSLTTNGVFCEGMYAVDPIH